MRVSVCAPIVDFKGSAILHPDGAKATFRSICVEILGAHIPDLDANKDAKYCMDLYLLAKKLSESEFVDLSIEELFSLKTRITAFQYNNIVKGRIYDILDGQNQLQKAPECSNG
jgi:hypothetical protein